MRNLVLLANPTSGRGAGARHLAAVLPELRVAAEVTLVAPADPAQAPDALRAGIERAGGAAQDVPPVVVALGGDGTVHLALQEAMRAGLPLAIIPAGSGNDGARELGLPQDPRQAAAVALAGRTVRVDTGRVEDREGRAAHFLCVLSSGFDSAVNERANAMRWPHGRARYVRALLAELAGYRAGDYRVTVDGQELGGPGMLVSVGNGRSFGGGMLICPAADLHDGLLDLIWLGQVGKLDLLRTFPKVFSGRHVSHPAISQRTGRVITLDAPGAVAYIDGERFGPLPVTITAQPDSLEVLVPAG